MENAIRKIKAKDLECSVCEKRGAIKIEKDQPRAEELLIYCAGCKKRYYLSVLPGALLIDDFSMKATDGG